jgi:Ca2+-transporting ATPase
MDIKNLTSSPDEICQTLNVDAAVGLNEESKTAHAEKYGKNEMPVEKVAPWWVIFAKTLIEPIQIILIIAALVSVLAPLGAHNWVFNQEDMIDFYVIISIIVIDATMETIQTIKARKSMDALKTLSKPRAVVLRNGQQQEIDASDLVVGDIVILEAGKYVPADLRIIEQSELMIDESILTGESLMVEKTHLPVPETAILAEMKNIAFMSTFTTNGRAIGVVVRVGVATEIGKIAASLSSTKEEATPLEKRLTNFSYWVAGVAFLIGIIIFVSLFFIGDHSNWAEYLMVAITLAVGVIPESLAAVVSITLSLSTKRMAKNNVIVKKLAAVETLGSVNVICTDKTGTLTENRMTVKKIIVNNEIVAAETYLKEATDIHKNLFLKSLVLCNDSVTEGKERLGDPTELALVDYAELHKMDEQDARKKWTRIDEKPFDSERKLMSTVNDIDGQKHTFTKGAIDQLLKQCTHILIDDVERKITAQDKEVLLKSANQLSSDALRVLAFAYNTKYDDLPEDEFEQQLTFVGAVAMIDPVRKSAIRAVAQAHDAGIDVVMITGDHAVTALAIGRELDLAHSEYEVMTSEKLQTMTDKELNRIIEQIHIFARVNPEHKVRIVDVLQNRSNITSMTGDGVNDAPSLAKADIGVAMGITGTDVSKQAADIILTDDNFETIIKGVYEGRNVFQKIRRAIAFVLGINLANVLGIFILSLINHVAPLEASDILWMNLVIESVLAICMGMSQNDPSLMKQKPVKGFKSLFNGIMFSVMMITITIAGVEIGSYYIGMIFVPEETLMKFHYPGWHDALIDPNLDVKTKTEIGEWGRTAMFIAVTCSPAIYSNFLKLTNWKSSKKIIMIKNTPLLYASIGAIVINIAILFVPGVNDTILKLVPVDEYVGDSWIVVPVVFALSFAPTIVIVCTGLLRHVIYHYKPEKWRRNQILVQNMVQQDKVNSKKNKTKHKKVN